MNGDGYADLLVGASRAGSKDIGAAYVVLGDASPAGGSLAGGGGDTIYGYAGEVGGDYAGASVAGAGDVNGDGFDDLLIGADGNDAGGSLAGAAYLVLGGASLQGGSLTGIYGVTVFKYRGEDGEDFAGASVAGAGDVNGDGYADLLIGADGNDDGPGNDAGAAYLVLGGASLKGGDLDGTGGDSIFQYTGEAASDFAGSAVAGAGDVNGDGYADLLVGADSNDDGGVDAGAAYLFFSDFLAPGNGPVRQRRQLHGSADPPLATFGQAGVRVDLAGVVSQGEVIVERHIFHPCDTSMRLQMPIWTINSNKIDSGSTIDIWFDYTDAMITGMAEESLTVWKRPDGQHCADWTQIVGAVTRYPELNRVKVLLSGVTGLSQFTLADAPPSPTAVRMVSMGTHLAQEPLWLVILLAMLVLTSGATYWYLRRQEERALATSQAHDLTDVIAAKVAALLRRPPEE